MKERSPEMRWPDYLLLMGVSIAVRLVFVLNWPFTGGDAEIYTTVAENILRGCGISLSDPSGPECVPHFGGNQLPGYPAFMAGVWYVTSHSDAAVRIFQAAAYSGSVALLASGIGRLTGGRLAPLGVGFLMALSPLQVAWPRYLQTETLALATTIWVIAELVKSIAENRLRIIPLFVALGTAIFVRLDGILLCVPAALVCFFIYKPTVAIRRGIVLMFLVLLPIAGWTVRNVVVGLPRLYPTPLTQPNNAPPPLGYAAWGRTWITEEYQRPGWGFGVTRFEYDAISIDQAAYDTREEEKYVEGLLEDLKRYTGKPFPAHIDMAFSSLARDRAGRAPFRTYVLLPLKRAKSLWANPYSSFGWPNEMPQEAFSYDDRLEVVRGGIESKIKLAVKYPVRALTKAFTGLYRFIIMVGMVVCVVWAFATSNRPLKHCVWIAVATLLARTVFLALVGNVETRYTVEAVPGMEMSVGLVCLSWRNHI